MTTLFRRLVAAVFSLTFLIAPSPPTRATDAPPPAPIAPETIAEVSGDTLMAGVSLGLPSDRETRHCVWHTTVVTDIGDNSYSLKNENGVQYRLYARTCRAENPASPDSVSHHWIPMVSETTLASQLADFSWGTLPIPLVGTAPPSHRGVVNVPMWWWVSPKTWRTISVSAWIPTVRGPLVVTVTAKPSALIVDPGDPRARNSGRFTCGGPGAAWRTTDGDSARSDCMHTYRHSVARSTGTVSIRWSVSWKSNWRKGGKLPSVHTTRKIDVAVHEIQALVNQ
jgi:hypothetical protein